MEALDWPREYREFVHLFNSRDYFEAHEVLEDLWVVEVPPLKNYYKGLIQAAVALCHWERGNHSGARKLWLSARGYLRSYPPAFEGLRLSQLMQSLEELFQPLLEDPHTPHPPPCRTTHPLLELEEAPVREAV